MALVKINPLQARVHWDRSRRPSDPHPRRGS